MPYIKLWDVADDWRGWWVHTCRDGPILSHVDSLILQQNIEDLLTKIIKLAFKVLEIDYLSFKVSFRNGYNSVVIMLKHIASRGFI